jgi:hypothetical protein
MGLLWRLFAPKGLKRARRKARKVAHPVRTASWALSPRPVKQAQPQAGEAGPAGILQGGSPGRGARVRR